MACKLRPESIAKWHIHSAVEPLWLLVNTGPCNGLKHSTCLCSKTLQSIPCKVRQPPLMASMRLRFRLMSSSIGCCLWMMPPTPSKVLPSQPWSVDCVNTVSLCVVVLHCCLPVTKNYFFGMHIALRLQINSGARAQYVSLLILPIFCPAANFWWGMVWEDDRTADLIASNGLNDPTYICQAWCSTEQGLDIILEELGIESNGTGQAACCDGECF